MYSGGSMAPVTIQCSDTLLPSFTNRLGSPISSVRGTEQSSVRLPFECQSSLYLRFSLTNNVQIDSCANFRLRRDLTLVDAFVACLYVLDLQLPRLIRLIRFAAGRMEGIEALVSDEDHPVNGQNVFVPNAHPRHGFILDFVHLIGQSSA